MSDIVLRLAKLTGITHIVPEVKVTGPCFMNLDPFILGVPYYYHGYEHHLCNLRHKIARLRD
ncbi:MAG TPA: hypothetical protein VK553_07020 [Candidatus Nitrosopolaris rasttigaisensis]|nr:hypothetical protein [Candidatus Nitrosopolaris rasttigaisensis]